MRASLKVEEVLMPSPRTGHLQYDRPGERLDVIAVNALFSLRDVNRRVIGIFLVLLLLGLGAGYALADAPAEEPGRLAGPEPVPAVSPAAPTITPIAVEEDPDTPPLGTNLPVVRERLQNAE